MNEMNYESIPRKVDHNVPLDEFFKGMVEAGVEKFKKDKFF